MPTRAICRFAAAAILALAIGAVAPLAPPALAQTLSAEMTDVFKRLADDAGGDATKLGARDQALLFMNNDAINAAALNNEIGDDLYQAAQSHYAKLNQDFGAASAHEAGAQFTTQVRTTEVYSPGTDSDFITVVDDADQIGRIQENYNRRVNQYLVENGALDRPRNDWHNKLDTDFMADPAVITDPEEFRKVAELNNDAYKRRMAAEYERLKRAKDGARIGPEHVTEFAEEMAEFSTKKGTKLDEMLKDPSQFNDPMKRAEAFRAMAQEQKYLARIEELEDVLRAQEGLPPRPRGMSIAEQGSIRSPHNVGAIRDARAVAGQTRTQALQDLIETMGEVAHKNPQFAASAADDVARVIAKLPPGERAAAVGILRTSNAGLARQVDATLDAMPRGLGALDDAARVGKMRKGLAALGDALDTIGRIGAAIEVGVAVAQMTEYVDLYQRLLDPATADDEAEAIIARMQAIAEELAVSGLLSALAEKHPAVAVAFAGWTVLCMAGEWVAADVDTGEMASRPSKGCGERQAAAAGHLWDWVTGKKAEDEAHRQAMCNGFKQALADGRVRLRESWLDDFLSVDAAVAHACWRLAEGEPLGDMIDRARIAAADPVLPPKKTPTPEPPPLKDTGGTGCDPAAVGSAQPETMEALDPDCMPIGDPAGGDEEGIDTGERRRIAEICSEADATIGRGRDHYRAGRVPEFRVALVNAERALDGLGDPEACADQRAEIAKGAGQADLLENVIEASDQALAVCSETQLRKLSALLAKTGHPHVVQLRATLDRMAAVAQAVDRADLTLAEGRTDQAAVLYREAAAGLNVAPGACAALGERVRDGQERARVSALDPASTADTDLARATTQCRATYGRLATAVPDRDSLDGFTCGCEAPYRLKDSACVPAETAAEPPPAETTGTCSSGYSPGPPDASGQGWCIPSQRTANAWCNANNKGTGWVAYGIDGVKGTYSCRVARANATAWCNQNNPGSGWRAVRFRNDGGFDCEQPAPPQTAQPPSQPAPSTTTRPCQWREAVISMFRSEWVCD